MKDKIIQTVSHPLFISIVLTLLTFSFLPEYFAKYEVELIQSKNNSRKSNTYFEDLNNDLKPERIMSYENTLGQASFEVHKSNKSLIDQYNFDGKFVTNHFDLWFFDADGDNFKEIYLLSRKNDSVFLQIEDVFSNNAWKKRNVFIDIIPDHQKKSFLGVLLFSKCDLDGNGTNEILININKGFSGTTRNIYAYDLTTDKVLKSPHLTNQSRIRDCIDLENDGLKELLISNYSAGNEIDSLITKRSDKSSWLMLLKNDLQFKFEPQEINSPFSSIHSIHLKNGKGDYDIISIINSKMSDQYPDKLIHISSKGHSIKEQILPPGHYNIFTTSNENEFLLLDRTSGQLSKYDIAFFKKDILKFEPFSIMYPLKLSKNNDNFWVISGQNYQNLQILDNNFKNPVAFQLDVKDAKKIIPKVLLTEKEINGLYIQSDNKYHVFSYSKNPLFLFRYLSYLILFLVIFGIVLLIRKGQQIRMEKQRAIENEISALQIRNINNQIDPHFVFNAINTISEMTLMENKLEADNFITKFSNFMRGTLLQSDKITTTLKDELSYVENFIQLQQERFMHKFDYSIQVNSNVDTSFLVPKHIVFCYVENAIKHGLSGLKEKGILKIHASQDEKKIILSIEDNGGGIKEKQKNTKDSTGSGLKIMDQLFELFNKLYKKTIEKEFIELYDEQNNKSGIKVVLKITI